MYIQFFICVVYSVQCTVYSVQCAKIDLKLYIVF